MKRLLFLIALLLLTHSVFGVVTVDLITPDGSSSSTNSVTFTCNAVSDGELLSTMFLYFGSEMTWHQNKSMEASGLNSSATFVVTGIPNGNYLWNCKAKDEANSEFFSNSNKTFTVNVAAQPVAVNHPPTFSSEIPNKKWYSGENITFILQDYFNDQDKDNLVFTVTGNSKISILISLGFVTLIPETGWTGSEKVKFIANDGNVTTQSNEVLLNVTTRNGKPNQSSPVVNKSPIESNFTVNNNEQASSNAAQLVNLPAKVQAPVCGDGKKDTNENCESCLKDAPCDEGFKCVSDGKCQKKSILPLFTAIIFILMAILTAGYFSYEYLLKGKLGNLFSKKEQSLPKEADAIKQAVKAEPTTVVSELKQEPVIKEPTKIVLPKKEPTKQTGKKDDPLKDYILKMYDKGHTINQIHDNLIKAGWPKQKIDEAFGAVKLNKQIKKP